MSIGQLAIYTFTVTDESGSAEVKVQGELTPNTSTLAQNGNTYFFSWKVVEIKDYSLTFVAVDSMNVVSTLSPRVEICACQNNGVCTLEGILGTMGNVIDMECECPPGMYDDWYTFRWFLRIYVKVFI